MSPGTHHCPPDAPGGLTRGWGLGCTLTRDTMAPGQAPVPVGQGREDTWFLGPHGCSWSQGIWAAGSRALQSQGRGQPGVPGLPTLQQTITGGSPEVLDSCPGFLPVYDHLSWPSAGWAWRAGSTRPRRGEAEAESLDALRLTGSWLGPELLPNLSQGGRVRHCPRVRDLLPPLPQSLTPFHGTQVATVRLGPSVPPWQLGREFQRPLLQSP